MGFNLKNSLKYKNIKKKIGKSSYQYLLSKHALPEPQIRLGNSLLKFADSCTDISDGLLPELEKITEYSNLGAQIFLSKIPLSDSLKKIYKLFGDKKKFWDIVLGGGEDYELLFSMSKEKQTKYLKKKSNQNFFFTKIGRLTKIREIKFYDFNLKSLKFKKIGYSHF